MTHAPAPDTLLNRAYLSRAGLPLGEVIIWFRKTGG
jgi:hypothetical protein